MNDEDEEKLIIDGVETCEELEKIIANSPEKAEDRRVLAPLCVPIAKLMKQFVSVIKEADAREKENHKGGQNNEENSK